MNDNILMLPVGGARGWRLPFPAVVVGQRVRIPKVPFLRWMGDEIKQKEVIT